MKGIRAERKISRKCFSSFRSQQQEATSAVCQSYRHHRNVNDGFRSEGAHPVNVSEFLSTSKETFLVRKLFFKRINSFIH